MDSDVEALLAEFEEPSCYREQLIIKSGLKQWIKKCPLRRIGPRSWLSYLQGRNPLG
jgi:hypothetical protein